MLDGKAYLFTDDKGSKVPAMRDPTTNAWVPDQRAMAQAGMAQIGSKVAAPEDDAALKDMVKEVGPAQDLANAARHFMEVKGKTQLGPRYGALPVYGGDAQSMARRSLARSDPNTEATLEQLEAINSANWPTLRPEGSGPIRVIEAKGWKNAFPSISNVDAADQGITDTLWQKYVDKSNATDFAQQYVHGGKGGVPAARAAFQNLGQEANAKGRHQALGAAPRDFSGNLPGWSGDLPPRQLAAAKLYANSRQPPGSKRNPLLWSPTANLPPESWVIDDDGGLVQMPKAKR
jgi:hypothetical protein